MKRCRPMLGTLVEVSIDDVMARYDVARAFVAAFRAIERVSDLMSFHLPGSDLSRLNATPAGHLLELDPWTVEVLALSAELAALSDGLFDCDVGRELIDWGLLPRGSSSSDAADADADVDVPADAPARSPSQSQSTAFDVIDEKHVRLRRRVCLDLGGIAKGYAVDRAVEALVAHGVEQATVNAGGDLRVLGAAAAPIHVRRPDGGPLIEIGVLANGALATSSTERSGHWRDGVFRSALVDPRTRLAVGGLRSYSVFAERCAVADGLTKCLAIAGKLDQRCIDRFGAVALVL